MKYIFIKVLDITSETDVLQEAFIKGKKDLYINMEAIMSELSKTYSPKEIEEKYKIGTLPEFNNGTIFWQIDEQKKVRAGKVIQYFETGKRTKNITWMHQFLKMKKER